MYLFNSTGTVTHRTLTISKVIYRICFSTNSHWVVVESCCCSPLSHGLSVFIFLFIFWVMALSHFSLRHSYITYIITSLVRVIYFKFTISLPVPSWKFSHVGTTIRVRMYLIRLYKLAVSDPISSLWFYQFSSLSHPRIARTSYETGSH